MSRYCLTVDLKDDPALIQQCELPQKVWPDPQASRIAVYSP
jgi:hypothetical protein